LINTSREIQAEGWTFNTEEYYELVPATNGDVDIPNNVLQIDVHEEKHQTHDAIRRNGKLYDKTAHTYDWSDWEKVQCDIVWFFDWVDLPRPIQDYIVARAAATVSSRITGDAQQYQVLKQKELFNRATALEYECNQGDYTFFGHQRGSQTYTAYKPYTALSR